MTVPDPPLFDAGNPLLATGAPVNMVTGKIPTPDGEVGVVTIRTVTTTITLTLDKEMAATWRDAISELHDSLAGNGLMAASKRTRLIVPGR